MTVYTVCFRNSEQPKLVDEIRREHCSTYIRGLCWKFLR